MSGRCSKVAFTAGALAIVLLGYFLRSLGTEWGLPEPQGFGLSLHPDERAVMDSLAHTRISQGDFCVNSHFVLSEGQFQYSVWAVVLFAAKSVGWIDVVPDESSDPDASASVLALLRQMVVLTDCISLALLLFLGRRRFGMLGATAAGLVFAVLPAFVVSAHFARTHTPANLFVLLEFFVADRLGSRLARREPTARLEWLLLGGLSGLAFATRYNLLSIGLFPAILSLQCLFQRESTLRRRVAGPLLGLGGLLIGLGVGMPSLITEPGLVMDEFSFRLRISNPQQFTGWSIVSVERVWPYLSWLIPIGTWPLLWPMLFAAIPIATAISIMKRDWIALSVPVFALFNLYYTAKGYWDPAWVRAALPFLAGSVLALAYVISQLRPWRRLQWATLSICVLLCLPSAWYDFQYDLAMKERDPLLRAKDWIDANVKGGESVSFMTQTGVLRHWPQSAEERGSLFAPETQELTARVMSSLEKMEWLVVARCQGQDLPAGFMSRYTIRELFENAHVSQSSVLKHERWPPDWVYPFGKVWILKAIAPLRRGR